MWAGPQLDATAARQSPESTCAELTVSVVICAYTEDRWPDLAAALYSVASQSTPPLEVLLVIDHCDPLLVRARHAFGSICVVPNSGPQGLSGARNTGLEHARGSIVAFLDDDARADSHWLERLVAGYADEQVQGVGGAALPSWVDGRPRWFPPEFDWVVGCTHSGMPASVADVRNFVGANMSLRRDALDQLGGFSSHLGRSGTDAAGCEETELCIRAGQLTPGSHLVYDPEARVHHTVPPQRATARYFLRRCYAEGRSKATVSQLTTARQGLAAERTHLTRTIPVGMLRCGLSVVRGDLTGVTRALAMAAGVCTAIAGFIVGRIRNPRMKQLRTGINRS